MTWTPNAALLSEIVAAVQAAGAGEERYDASAAVRDAMTARRALIVEQGGVEVLRAVVTGAMAIDGSEYLTVDGDIESTTASEFDLGDGSLVARLVDLPQTTTGGASGRDPTLWPFAVDSPWNWPIGSGAQLASASDAATTRVRDLSEGWNVNSSNWSMPVYYASNSDPLQSFAVTAPNAGFRTGTVTLRCPSSAISAPPDWSTGYTDAHLCIIDPDGQTAHEFWRAKKIGTNAWTAEAYTPVALNGSGFALVTDYGPTSYYTHAAQLGYGGTRAFGGSQLGGLIRTGELTNGIKHALALAAPKPFLSSPWVWPATRDDYPTSYPNNGAGTAAIRCGQLFVLPKSINVASLGLDAKGTIIARALQDYGAYIVDMADTWCLYIDYNARGEISGFNSGAFTSAVWGSLVRVTNNSAGSVGGGGTPLAALAPGIGSSSGGTTVDGDPTYELTSTSVGLAGSGSDVELSASVEDGAEVASITGTLTWPSELGSGSGGTTTSVDTSLLLLDWSPGRSWPVAASPANRDADVVNARLTAESLDRMPMAYIGTTDATYNPAGIGSSTSIGTHSDTYDRLIRTTLSSRNVYQMRVRSGDAPPNDSGSIARVNKLVASHESPYAGWLQQGHEYLIGFGMTRAQNDTWDATTFSDIIALSLTDESAGPPAVGVHIYNGGDVNAILRSASGTLEVLPTWAASGTATMDYYVAEIRLASTASGGSPYFRLYRASGAAGALSLVASSTNYNNYGGASARFLLETGIIAWAGGLQFASLATAGLIMSHAGVYAADKATYPALTRESLLAHMRTI